ncbi:MULTISPECIES: flagellar hook-associated family protein [unclassified Rhizobium]|uniref:flagellar hook-associated family protein n=1 Tax=unclassified Rhizobium TaxID=2613769 RepID=UPI001603E674|nr:MULTISPECIES: flagellar hook-associated family protein [unclassified Rhizobium]MBB1248747.1 flagellar hook-associated family protein [Rhizobium sp. G21]MCV3766257.1 flagellar hook-associated family protein [Rhizobium sp. TRM95796]
MKTSFISNISVQNAMRSTINSVQAELIDAQREVVSGVYSNVGKELGATTTRSLNLHSEVNMMENLLKTNAVVEQRLSSTQTALDTIAGSAQTGLNTLVALSGSNDDSQLMTVKRTMTDVLEQAISAGNTSVNGEYVLSGINTDEAPLADYMADGSPARQAFVDAFTNHFGFAPTDPGVGSIQAADMEAFITDELEPMFLTVGGDWETNWSNASSTPTTARISRTEVIQSSSTTITDGFRYMAMASVMAIEMLNSDFSIASRNVVSNTAISFMGQAISGVDADRSQLGLSQNRVKQANETLQAQIDIVKLNLDDLEGVDVYEASNRITALSNQMEISYSLTARINELSLVNAL